MSAGSWCKRFKGILGRSSSDPDGTKVLKEMPLHDAQNTNVSCR